MWTLVRERGRMGSMEPVNIIRTVRREELRSWLMEHHELETECWVAVHRSASGEVARTPSILYLDAVEEALCFGWIDSTVKRVDSGPSLQRFSARRAGCNWSELNKARCLRLEQLGLMQPAGRIALSQAKPFVVDADILTALKKNRRAWKNVHTFPPLYVRVRLDTIRIARRRGDLFYSRLNKFIDNSAQGIMYGAWDDGGRLASLDIPLPF